jgi:hypothetical protein
MHRNMISGQGEGLSALGGNGEASPFRWPPFGGVVVGMEGGAEL